MRLYFIFGLPGAGKGVCAQKLKLYKNFVHFSLGDFLRDQERRKTDLGKKHSKEILSGLNLLECDLVSDIVINQINLTNQLQKSMIIDGFPRTLKQLSNIEEFLVNKDIAPKWIFFDTDIQTAMLRLLNRKHCAKCGIDYILTETREENKCDYCEEYLITRSTDNEHDILRRCNLFYKTTYHVVKHLERKNMLTFLSSGGCLETFSNWFVAEFS